MKNKQRKRKIRKAIISVYNTIGIVLIFAAIIFAAGVEDTVKYFDGSLSEALIKLVICLIMGTIGAYMLNDSSKYCDV